MTLNDIYAAQIEAHYFILISFGAFFAILTLVVWYGFKQVAEAVEQQKIVVREAVYEPNGFYYPGWSHLLIGHPPVTQMSKAKQ